MTRSEIRNDNVVSDCLLQRKCLKPQLNLSCFF